MRTHVFRIGNGNAGKNAILKAAQILKRGGIAAFPTETVYGLGANALEQKAVKKIFMAKGRPSDNPVIVHVSNPNDVFFLARPDNIALKLIEKFWPGPLTLVLKSSGLVPDTVTSGLKTIAIRMPSHPVALALIDACGFPIAAPSANVSGKPSATTAQHVLSDLNGKIEAILDAGAVEIGVESTVLDVSGKTPVLLRPGKITIEQIEKITGKIKVHKAARGKKLSDKDFVKAPGMKYRHYAPKADVILVERGKNSQKRIAEIMDSCKKSKGKTGFIVCSRQTNKMLQKRGLAENIFYDFLGPDAKSVSRGIFSSLREMDLHKVKLIVIEGIEANGLGLAVMNRLRKSAGAVI